MNDPLAIAEENRRIRELQRTVDLALFYIRVADLGPEEATDLVARVKAKALLLFPGKEQTFDLIYLPRFRRVLTRRFGMH
ncbi:MAG: hypothetical protein KKB20_17135 [Proteobacteria bacterium]|nr:hypothetical protein [Pseudomonadota bacterium]